VFSAPQFSVPPRPGHAHGLGVSEHFRVTTKHLEPGLQPVLPAQRQTGGRAKTKSIIIISFCGKTEWQVHAYCLMRNHFHLVLETPQPNLVLGMKWLLGVYTKRFNIRHKLCGHLFAGRYKALVVEGSGNGYLRTVCDYVHLNPVRAKLLPPEVALESYSWSSYPEYLKPAGQRPGWLRVDRLLGEGYPKGQRSWPPAVWLADGAAAGGGVGGRL